MNLSRDRVPAQCSAVQVSSAVVAAAVAVATMPAVANKLNYLEGFMVSGGGATLGALITVTIGGVRGGNISLPLAVVAGALLGVGPYSIEFPHPLVAANVNTAITVTVPSFGAGNTAASVTAFGFVG